MKTLIKNTIKRLGKVGVVGLVILSAFFASALEAQAAISFVGSAEGGAANNANPTADLTTISGLAENDLVIAACGMGDGDAVNLNVTMSSAGYTGLSDLFIDDVHETNFEVFYKFMSSSPDTSAVCLGTAGGNDTGTAIVVMAFRGVDTTTPFDVASTSVTGISDPDADPPSIDWSTSGVWTVIAGASAHILGNSCTSDAYVFPTGYTTNQIECAGNDTVDISVSMGYNSAPADPENPGIVDHNGTDSADNSWAAVTMALRPAAAVAPTVTTQAETNLTESSATVNGNITATGGENATVRGFAWGTNSTLSNGDTATTTENGSFDTGAFTGSLSSLTCNTTYYSRPYATNPAGTGYGTIDSFTTSACPVAPTVTTQDPTADNPWELINDLYASKSLSITTQDITPQDIAFSSDGTKAYIIGTTNDTIYQYTLSTAWDIYTGSYASKSLSVATQEATPTSLSFSSDGTKAYIVGNSNNTIYQYTLSTAWDISTGSYASKSLSVVAQENLNNGLSFSSDGTKAYVVGSTNDTIYQYTLSTAWDISTGSYASKSLSVTAQETTPQDLDFSSDGTKAYVGGNATDKIYQYTLSTAWDISTGSYASKNLSVLGQETVSTGLAFSSDGTKAYIVGNTNDTIYQYIIGGLVMNGNITDTGGSNATARGFAWGTGSTLSGGDTATTTESGSFGTGAFTESPSSQTCNTTYYTRAYATNTTGTGYGSITSTTTSPCLPTVTTQDPSSVAATSFTANGNITATGGENATVRGFAWGTNSALSGGDTATTTESGSFGTGAFTGSISSLTCNTIYYTRAYARNVTGTSTGSITSTTTTPCIPTVTTQAESNVTASSATVNGNITATGGVNATTRGFAWGTNSALSGGDTATTTENGSFGAGAFTGNLSSLTCGTTYYSRPYATNTAGNGYGTIDSFTTSACPISVTTDAVSAVTATNATFNGTLLAAGSDYVSQIGFAYGTNATLSTVIATTSEIFADPGAGLGAFVDAPEGALTCNTTYYVRAYAFNNSSESAYGTIVSFTTSACAPTVTTQAASSITATSTVLNGNVTSTGGADAKAVVKIRGFAYGTNSALSGGDTATTTERANAIGFNAGAFLGATSTPAWTAKTAWNTPNPGSNARPGLGDLDHDGDYDVLLGEFDGPINGIENTGSASSPTWTAKAAWDVADPGGNTSAALADLDNDGDYDLSIGDFGGVTLGYENTGSAASPTWTAKTAWNTSTGATTPFPAFADLDNDGDYDLMIGTSTGASVAYRNTGSASSPTWTLESTWNLPDPGSTAYPTFADLDNDGDLDALVGIALGTNIAYENTGSAASPTWTAKTAWNTTVDVGNNAASTFADLDDDGDLDLLIGEGAGVSFGYENTGTTTLTGLVCNTTYYARAYAVNSVGTSTGSIVNWTTSSCDNPPTLDLLHYRWREDDGSESAATYATAQDASHDTGVYTGDRKRLRMLLSNTGTGSATNYQYMLEHSSTSCSVWQTVPTPSSLANEHWVMDPSSHVDDGGATTDLAGLSNPGGKTFAAGLVNDISNTMSAHTLTNSQFTELEFSVRSTSNVSLGTTYCFRVTNAGSTANFTYTVNPSILVSAVVNRPAGGGGSGAVGGGGESSSGGGQSQGGGGQGGGGGAGGGEGEGGGYTYPTPVGGGGGGGGGGDSGNALSSSYAAVINVLSETIIKTIDMLNKAFLRD